MRVSREEMEKSHARIVASASRLARERGIENTSVAEVMGDAGLTQGGFYRHFESKDALMQAAVASAFEVMGDALAQRFETRDPRSAASGYRADYLHHVHVENPGKGCPMPTLAADVARGSDALKAAFGAGVSRAAALLASAQQGTQAEKRAQAMRELAMLVGAVVIARASDPETARAVLAACRVEGQ